MASLEDKLFWNNRYANGRNSGAGSYGEMLEKKLKWLKGLDIQTICEIGCGDFNFGHNLMKLYPKAYYIGQDISEYIIDKNRKDFLQYQFTTDMKELIQADLTLCIDVLFHITDDREYEDLLTNIENNWTKYLAITAYEYENPHTSPHVKIRKFDPKRYGEPIIREIAEENGSLMFYLFKKSIDLRKVSAVLITKEKIYPQEIVDNIDKYPFGQVLILTNSDSPYRKYEMIKKAKFDLIYYQDDDAICNIADLVKNYKEDMINVLMDAPKIEQYKNERMTMGLGWGALFNKSILKELKRYTKVYGKDTLFKRDTEKILTELVYPQNRIVSPHIDLPSAMAEDRLWRQPEHWSNMDLIRQRVSML